MNGKLIFSIVFSMVFLLVAYYLIKKFVIKRSVATVAQ